MPVKPRRRKPYTPEQKARIVQVAILKLQLNGWSIHRVAKFKKVDPRTLKKWLAEEKAGRGKLRTKKESLSMEVTVDTRKAKEAMRKLRYESHILSKREFFAIAIAEGLYSNPRYVPLAIRLKNLFMFLIGKGEYSLSDHSGAAVHFADLLLAELDRTSK